MPSPNRNPLDDGASLSSAVWNAQTDALVRDGVVSGCAPSIASGNDVDVTSGEIAIGGAYVTVSSGSVTLAASDSTDRIDLVTATSGGSLNAVTGTPADSETPERPVAPDIPSGEVLLAVVLVPADSADLSDTRAVLADYRAGVPDSATFDTLAAESAPTSDTDVVRKVEADTKADLTEVGGVLVSEQVPDLAITNTFVVADEAERLALDVQEGDVAIQQDVDETYIFTGGDATNTANWSQILFPEAPVTSVFGRTGDVTAQSGDYTYSEIDGTHGNEDHTDEFVSDGDGTTREIWVIANGASDPAGADPEDLIFEEEA